MGGPDGRPGWLQPGEERVDEAGLRRVLKAEVRNLEFILVAIRGSNWRILSQGVTKSDLWL